jgi:hypothetical protein
MNGGVPETESYHIKTGCRRFEVERSLKATHSFELIRRAEPLRL